MEKGPLMAKRFVLIVAMLFIPVLARADSVWAYTGNGVGDIIDYPQANQADGVPIIGTVTFEDPLKPFQQSYPAESFSFSQGSYFNNSNAMLQIDPFGFGETTAFVSWTFSVFSGGKEVMRSIRYDIGESMDLGPVSGEQGRPGTWTEIATINAPEPGSLLLLGAELTALALAISLQKSVASILRRFFR
jgi:hypothetical protein